MPNFTAELVPAMLTPFKRDETIDFERVEELANYLVDHGCDGLLVNGTTGESPTLSFEEKVELVKVVKKAVNGKKDKRTGNPIQIMTGAGGNDTRKTIEEAKKMAALGVDALLIVVPYYNKPTQRGMVEHFTRVAQSVDTDIIIYNIPSRSVVRMEVATMKKLHEKCRHIIGVKQSYPDMDAVSEITQELPAETWLTWCGDDSLTVPMIACGAHGTFSVLAHLTAPLMRDMIVAAKSGDREKALKLHLKQLNLAREIFFLPNPVVTKTCMARLGLMEPTLRLPMVPPEGDELARIDKILAEYKTLMPQTVS